MSFIVPSSAAAAALTCTALISLVPNLLLLAFPNYATDANVHDSLLLNMGQALAAGGLLGDVFLHTLPHSTDEQAGAWILVGFGMFLAVDVLIRSLGGHDHHHGEENKSNDSNSITAKSNGEIHNLQPSHSSPLWFSSTILLNLSADALHNFTDGIAIGASFALDHHEQDNASFGTLLYSRGGLVALSILFHEVPHELGDFCVLVNGGFSKSRAIMAQFGTAIAAMAGTVVGLWGVSSDQEAVIFMTAGGFVYLATVNILPTVLETTCHNKSFAFKLAQLCAFGMGIAFMHAVSLMEEHDHGHGHHHDHHHHHGHHEEDHHVHHQEHEL